MHPEDNSADILFLDNGARAAGVPIMAGAGTSNRTGTVDQPEPDFVGGSQWEPRDSKKTDITAVIGWIGNQPIITGYLFPQVSQMLFADADRRISRHTSDVYSTIDKDGNAEFYHPSGAYVRFGASPAHEDLTGQDLDGKWLLQTLAPVYIHVEQAGGMASIDIAPDGAITIMAAAGVAINLSGGHVVVTGGDVIADGISLKTHKHRGAASSGSLTSIPV